MDNLKLSMTSELRPSEFIEKHRLLELDLQRDRSNFLSDWNGRHPFLREFLGKDFPALNPATTLSGKYLYLDNETSLIQRITSFHRKQEKLSLSRSNVVAGPGSSSLLAAFSLWLLKEGHKTVYYIPPLYYTLHYFFRLLGIRLRPVASEHLFSRTATVNLPPKKSVLLMTDPIWYAGWSVPEKTIEQIAAWQCKTQSIVFVDGSFQYTHWDGRRHEHTAILAPSLTFRLVCPAKALGIPTFRFAYLLHPKDYHDDLLFLYESMIGSASASDVQFAYRAMEVLQSLKSNKPFTCWLQKKFEKLTRRQLVETTIPPSCGYFIFAKPNIRLPGYPIMNEEYFELRGYPEYIRINLMGAEKLLSLRINSSSKR
jgi:aspartate/methionine/tyrosine aminotransferase